VRKRDVVEVPECLKVAVPRITMINAEFAQGHYFVAATNTDVEADSPHEMEN
jgi:hypothetical protein